MHIFLTSGPFLASLSRPLRGATSRQSTPSRAPSVLASCALEQAPRAVKRQHGGSVIGGLLTCSVLFACALTCRVLFARAPVLGL